MATRLNEIDTYLRVKIESASPMALIYMVYERAIKTLSEAKDFIRERNRNQFSKKIIHAQDCIKELRSSLNLEMGEIPKSLYRLYEYMLNELVEATITRENPMSKVNKVERMLSELLQTWKTAEKNLNQQKKVGDPLQSLSLVG